MAAAARILVPLDGSEPSSAALPVAAALGVRLGVPVEVLDCLPPAIPPGAELAWARERGAEVGVDVPDDAVHSTLEVVQEITAAAARQPGTIVCMASHGRTAVGELLYGSITHDVIVASPSPVVVVGPRAHVPESFATVQVCIDGSPTGQRALGAAAAWATALHGVPWLTQVVEPLDLEPELAGDVLEGAVLGRLAKDPRFAGLQVEWDVLHGHDVVGSLARWATEHGAGLLVTSSHGRSGIQRMRLGSVTARLIHEATRPVLVVGPAVATD
jgi:nucleotide-binding universal stress UspA family protein